MPLAYRIARRIAGALVIAALFLFALHAVNSDRVIYGAFFGKEFFVGGLRLEEARTAIRGMSAGILATPLRFTLAEQNFSYTATPQDLGVVLDSRKMAEKTEALGHERNMVSRLRRQLAAFASGAQLPVEVAVNEERFLAASDNFFGALDVRATNADLLFDATTGSFSIQEAREGLVADRTKLKEVLAAHAQTLILPPEIPLERIAETPSLTTKDAEETLGRAHDVLETAPHTLTFDAESAAWIIDKNTFGSWLTVEKEYEGAALRSETRLALRDEAVEEFLLREVIPAVNREPVNAEFTVKEDRVVAFALSQPGRSVDIPATIAEMERVLRDNIPPSSQAIPLSIQTVEPRITTETIDTLGIRALIGTGESDFSGSPKNRKHNIRIGAAKYNGVLIAPNEEFSFNKILGNVGPEEGYLPELVIKKDKTIPEYGGGLCQVATTAFRAAIYSGLEITERYPHAFVVRYYGKPGFDATIYPPHPDLRFKNDTPGHILIQTRILGTKLTFEFYGTNDGREVTLEGPRAYDQKPDGSAKATLTQKVVRGGEVVREKTFYSSYRSPALYPVSQRNPLE